MLLLSILYRLLRCLLGLTAVLMRRDLSKDVELLVLRQGEHRVAPVGAELVIHGGDLRHRWTAPSTPTTCSNSHTTVSTQAGLTLRHF
jgi:hypothetical protein